MEELINHAIKTVQDSNITDEGKAFLICWRAI
jgi:hypothetical protein